MKELHISEDLSLPLEAVTNTHLILARRRVGKTYLGAVMAEEMIKAGLPWVALDPTGAWWGLTSSADGKSEGLPVIVIGGPHGHIPLEPSAGKVIANLIVDHPGWYVIDFSRFNNTSDERRFSADFGTQLYRRKQRSPSALHLFVDEADMFVPQKLPKDGKPMFDAFDAIVRRGGVYGLGVTLITQRPAIVNKDVTTQCETLIALQTTAPQDQDPIFDWVSRNGTAEQLKEIKKTLASLKVGQAWFFSPNSDVFKLIQIRKRETFNSSQTPKPGAKPIEPKVFAAIDVEKLGEEIASTVERSRQEDPEFLRRQINQLKRELSDRSPVPTETKIVEIPVITKEEIEKLEGYLSGVNSIAQEFKGIEDRIKALLNGKIDSLNSAASSLSLAIETAKKSEPARERLPRAAIPTPTRAPASRPANPSRVTAEGITGPQQKVIDAIAWMESIRIQRPKRPIVAFLAGYSVTSSTFTNILSSNKTAGLSTYPDSESVELTEAGRALANPQAIPLNTKELHNVIFSRLPSPQAKVLRPLIEAYPDPMNREELADRAGYSLTSSTFTNILSSLRTMGIIDYPNSSEAVALPVLFLE